MAVSLPMSFDKFKKDPMKAVLYIALIAIGWLYIDGRSTDEEIRNEYKQNNITLTAKVDSLQKQILYLSIELAKLKGSDNE